MDNEQQPNQDQQQMPPPEQTAPQQPTPSVFESNKTFLVLGAFLALIIIVGAAFFFVFRNLQNIPQPTVQKQTSVSGTMPTQPEAQTVSSPPSPQQSTPSDAKRKADLLQIQEGIYKYKQAKKSLPPQITTTAQSIAKEGSDLCTALVPAHIPSLPKDPLSEENPDAPIGSVKDCSTMYITGYVISKNDEGNVTITAPFAQEETIMVKF